MPKKVTLSSLRLNKHLLAAIEKVPNLKDFIEACYEPYSDWSSYWRKDEYEYPFINPWQQLEDARKIPDPSQSVIVSNDDSEVVSEISIFNLLISLGLYPHAHYLASRMNLADLVNVLFDPSHLTINHYREYKPIRFPHEWEDFSKYQRPHNRVISLITQGIKKSNVRTDRPSSRLAMKDIPTEELSKKIQFLFSVVRSQNYWILECLSKGYYGGGAELVRDILLPILETISELHARGVRLDEHIADMKELLEFNDCAIIKYGIFGDPTQDDIYHRTISFLQLNIIDFKPIDIVNSFLSDNPLIDRYYKYAEDILVLKIPPYSPQGERIDYGTMWEHDISKNQGFTLNPEGKHLEQISITEAALQLISNYPKVRGPFNSEVQHP